MSVVHVNLTEAAEDRVWLLSHPKKKQYNVGCLAYFCAMTLTKSVKLQAWNLRLVAEWKIDG